MKLSVKERLTLLALLPKEGDFRTLKYLRKYKEALALSDKEQKDLEIKQAENGMVTWNGEKAAKMDKEIVAKKPIVQVIKDTLEKLDKEKKLTEDTMDLFAKFIGDDEEEGEEE